MKCKKCGAYIDTKMNEGYCLICGHFQKIQTNGDKIRNMNNFEIACFIAELVYNLNGAEIKHEKSELIARYEQYLSEVRDG